MPRSTRDQLPSRVVAPAPESMIMYMQNFVSFYSILTERTDLIIYYIIDLFFYRAVWPRGILHF
ncbi:hypothetical protein CKA38_01875 [Ereboglobus luteus]|uniref:Uncharacterized protein n=1 Tax=Ereboglobus luteus TaxID=1796921 RepID=A0A2U8DZZ6_9BACT|nr:hypothetical protein CKA38_01875 [Ereboglobus luteus]